MTKIERSGKRDALYNAGCWEATRLGWEETYGAPEAVEADATEPTVVDSFSTQQAVAELRARAVRQ